jgi:hypothetical protein
MAENTKNLLEWVKEYNLDVRKFSADNYEANQNNEYFIIEWLMEQGFDFDEASAIEEYYKEH